MGRHAVEYVTESLDAHHKLAGVMLQRAVRDYFSAGRRTLRHKTARQFLDRDQAWVEWWCDLADITPSAFWANFELMKRQAAAGKPPLGAA